jgi:hypothetical protein
MATLPGAGFALGFSLRVAVKVRGNGSQWIRGICHTANGTVETAHGVFTPRQIQCVRHLPLNGDTRLPLEESRSAVLVLVMVGGLPNEALAHLAAMGTKDPGMVQGRLTNDVQFDDYD